MPVLVKFLKQREKANKLLEEKNVAILEQNEKIETQAKKIKEANLKLIELDEFKQGMTGMIVHDLKNPLNAIINASDNQLVRYKKRVQQSGKQMLNMVLNILDVYKYEESQLTVDKATKNVYDIAQNALNEIAFLADQKSISTIYCD